MVENPTGKTPPSDNLIPNTIASIFSHFCEQKQRIVVYICETADFRAASRNRKFYRWFDWYKGTAFVKIDMQMGQNSNGETYFTSMILRLDNPEIGNIVTAFRNLILSNIK